MGHYRSLAGNSLRIPSPEATPEQRQEAIDKAMKHYPELMTIPDAEADPEAFKKVFHQLGAPEATDGYTMPEFDSGFKLPEDREKFLREAALEAGVTKKQFTQFMTKVIGADAEAITQANETKEQALATLKQEWGGAFETRKQQITTMLGQFEAPAEMIEALVADPKALTLMHNIAKGFGSETVAAAIQSGGEGGGGGISPEEASERAQEIRESLLKMNPNEEGYDAKIKRMLHYEKLASAA